ncbi:hypothetical protein C2E23DRAFT_886725 [Lenzites betulinus]|nr:hypothetical protein C2E23DRAFT_886725 [Lenzites betulinus]
MAYNYSRISSELWDLVVKNLPHVDQRNCLSVSKLFRDHARPLLFSRVTIRIGMWKAEEDEGFFDDDVELMTRRNVMYTEMLQYIAGDAKFAKIVKGLSVLAHDQGYCDPEEDTDEDVSMIPHIIKALEVLPHLRSFRWYGTSPLLTSSVLDALARTCGPTLAELSISVFDWGEDASQYLAQFKNLQTLSLAGEPRQFPLYHRDENVEPQLTALAKSAPDTLRCLSVWRDAVWASPPSVFSGLHELSLQDPNSFKSFGSVLEQCSQLRTLNILASNSECGPQLTTALKAAPHALPHLASFKLICSGSASVVDPDPIIAFLQGKIGMRRVDLALNKPFANMDAYTRFLDIFIALPRLEVVGLELQGKDFTRGHMTLLDKCLPLRVSALLLTWGFRVVDDAVTTEDWTAMLKTRVSLGYVHVLDRAGNLDLRPPLLKDHSPATELLGYGSRLSGIERNATTGEWTFAPLWEDTTTSFRTVEDFGCGDWEWLLRNHDGQGLQSLEPFFYFKDDKEEEYWDQ